MAKWGAGHVAGMWRAGLKELAQALKATPQSIGPMEEPGLAGNPTPQEVVEDKKLDKGNVYGKEKPTFQRDPGYEEWLDQQAAMRQSPSNELGKEI